MNNVTAPRPRAALPGLALAAALVALTAAGAHAQAGLGDPAPGFTLTGNDGMSYTLSDAFGDQVQMLYFIGYN